MTAKWEKPKVEEGRKEKKYKLPPQKERKKERNDGEDSELVQTREEENEHAQTSSFILTNKTGGRGKLPELNGDKAKGKAENQERTVDLNERPVMVIRRIYIERIKKRTGRSKSIGRFHTLGIFL